MKHRRSGFTLIEMLVTVALLGVITVLSVTALGPLQARYNRRQAADLVASTAARAQLLARETGRCHGLEIHDEIGGVVSKVTIPGNTGDRLRLVRRTTADCHRDLIDTTNPDPVEPVEWVRMPGRMVVSVDTGKNVEPLEWRPNSRIRKGGETVLVVALKTDPSQRLLIRMMEQGPVCVSDSATEVCP
ncbi:MAG TPA: type II secretion system protein [Myxococcaceae bacterium]|nr:type II secretion system protein [Myxococcaceae bacterium]